MSDATSIGLLAWLGVLAMILGASHAWGPAGFLFAVGNIILACTLTRHVCQCVERRTVSDEQKGWNVP